MEGLFLALYDFFKNKRILFFAIVLTVCLIALFLASRIRFEEDITKMITGTDNKAEVTQAIEKSGFLEKIIITVSMADTAQPPDPVKMINQAAKLADTLQNRTFQPYVKGITFRISPTAMEDVLDIVYRNLPVFLEDKDYFTLDTLLTNAKIEENLSNSYNTLLSPASFVMKKMIVRDPAGISGLALKKLSAFQQDENYRIVNNCLFSKDKKHLLLFLTTAYPASATSQNTVFLRMLERVVSSIMEQDKNELCIEYFGSAVVAVGNAERLKKDIRLTLSITLVLLLLIITFSIRKKRLFPFIFLPAIFGGLIALAVIYPLFHSASVRLSWPLRSIIRCISRCISSTGMTWWEPLRMSLFP
jgi:predicted exporter